MENILLIDKPKGITSYDVIRKLKKKYPPGTKIGHAGTLDPNATGLLIIGIGDGTKKLREYGGLDKTYEAEVLFGTQTDSGDITGTVVSETPMTNVKFQKEDVEKALRDMVGTLRLPVSKFSAKKIGGQPLYKRAHAGKEAPIILQDMTVRSAELLDIIHNSSDAVVSPRQGRDKFIILKLHFEVSSGTYIRSLAEELGRRLVLPATLKNLRRTRIGQFKIGDAENL